MVNVAELVVRAIPDGIKETKGEVEDLEESVEKSTGAMEEQASSLARFSGKFAGAMSVAVTGLALASAGLLSQVPVVGEAFDGLAAVTAAVGRAMDLVLRPSLTKVTDELFDLAAGIDDADEDTRRLIGTLASLGTALVVAGAAFKALKVLGLTGPFAALAGIIKGALVTAAAALGISFGALAAILLVIIGLAVGLYVAYQKNLFGFRDIVNGVVAKVKEDFQELVDFLNGGWKEDLKNFKEGARLVFKGVKVLVAGYVDDIVDKWDSAVARIKSKVNSIMDFIEPVASAVGVDINTDSLNSTTANAGVNTSNKNTATDFRGRDFGMTVPVNLDGTRVEQNQGGIRKFSLNGRGL